jgi:predicted dehydrogenase
MKIIIFGLGSMGKRRVRCLQSLGEHTLYGYDTNVKRVQEALTHNIIATSDLSELPLSEADAYFICTPPDKHEMYLEQALEFKKHCFVEASVLLGKLEVIDQEAKARNLIIAPSCTLLFHPAIIQIKKIIESNLYGKVNNFSYHCGQYLPDWHPWESVKDYYVSNPLTGGCREIVPFELTWITDCFGKPNKILACFGKTMDVGAEIDDTYAISLQFKDHFGVMLVDVTSRYAIRSLILNFERGQIHWRWDQRYLNIYDVNTLAWKTVPLELNENSASGYNPNIIEEMYINEVASFLKCIELATIYPNDLTKDISVLKLLNVIESEAKCDFIS